MKPAKTLLDQKAIGKLEAADPQIFTPNSWLCEFTINQLMDGYRITAHVGNIDGGVERHEYLVSSADEVSNTVLTTLARIKLQQK